MPGASDHNDAPPPSELTPHQIAIAHEVARAFVSRYGTPGVLDIDDLTWIGLHHWLQHRALFDPDGRASPDAYLRRVVWNRLQDVADRDRAQKRGSGKRDASLDHTLDDESDETLHDRLPSNAREADVEGAVLNRERHAQLTKLRAYLAPEDQELLDALWIDARVHAASRDLDISPSTAYGRLKRIHRTADEFGLRDLL